MWSFDAYGQLSDATDPEQGANQPDDAPVLRCTPQYDGC